MKIAILRRRFLGYKSCRKIKDFITEDATVIRTDKMENFKDEEYDLVIRWGTTAKFPQAKKVLNKASAIRTCSNKGLSREVMIADGVLCPKMNDNAGFPCIVRPTFHSQGKHLYFCNTEEELANAITAIDGDYYISEYIDKEREFGVFVFDGRVSSMVEKVAKTDEHAVAWNVAQGTHKFENLKWSEWDIPAAKEALKAVKALKLDFGRVDIMIKDGKAYVLEVNSAHSLTSPYRQNVFAKCVNYYAENGHVKYDLDLSKCKTFKSLIHPVLRKNGQGTNL